MPITFANPAGVAAPAGRYSHAALVTGGGRRLVISGQVGIAPDGTTVPDGEGQIEQALSNLGTILAAHGMTPRQVVKVTVFLTDRALVGPWREKRAALFGTHAPASTLLIVAGLASPDFLVEVEAEAAE